MRQILAVVMATTMLTSAEPVFFAQSAQAQSLFEALFPRAAERRRERERRQYELQKRRYEQEQARARAERKKRRVAVKTEAVKAPQFLNYVADRLVLVRISSLTNSFSAYDQKLLAEDVLQKEKFRLNRENPQVPDSVNDTSNQQTTAHAGEVDVKPVLVANQNGTQAGTITDAVVIKSVEPIATIEQVEPSGLAQVRLSAAHAQLSSIRLLAEKKLGDALVGHYSKSPVFLWVAGDGKPTEKAEKVLAVLADADAYGLRSADYKVPPLSPLLDASIEEKALAAARFEFELTAAALRYMSDARNGLVDPNRISEYHDFSGLAADYAAKIKQIAATDDAAKLLLDANPRENAFYALKDALAKLRAKVSDYDAVTVETGTFIRPGQNSDQLENIVESIRRKASDEMLSDHFDVFAVEHTDGEYTEDVAALVRDFQKSEGLKPDGIVGRNTVAKMQVDDPNVQLKKIIMAMERLRWQPDRLGNRYVFINQPQFTASFMVNGKPQVSMRAVVGKPENQTYFFNDEIEYVEFNPYWGVPRSILVNEYLPKLRRDASYLDRQGFEITTRNGKRISSSNVDWWSVGSDFPFNVRQPPDSDNALGELKIMFPNSHSIYMHDTPAKSLFARSERALSHGCVRLAEPRVMAAAVLGTTTSDVGAYLADGANKQKRLSSKIPVYVSYFTAWPDAGGVVHFYRDIYGRDTALEKAMGLEEQARVQARST